MIAAFAPELTGPNAVPFHESSCAPPGFSDARARIEEIEQLYISGYTTYQIADKLGLRPRDVGRNLRETRKRYQRAAQRQTQALAVGQCAAIQREAMEGWRRSQEPKRAVTTRRKSGEADAVTTRTEDRGGNCTFLNTALRAMKQLREIAADAPAEPRQASDAVRLALLDVLTPAKVATLDPGQVQKFRASLDRWSAILNGSEDKTRQANAPAQEPPIAETQAAPVPEAEVTVPEVQSSPDAVESNNAANDDQTPRTAVHRPHQPSRPRHPEWPAESVLTRSWLPPERDFATNGREKAVSCPVNLHERNGCAP